MALAAIVTDLIFSTKIVTEARAQGREVRILRSYSALREFLTLTPPDMLIVDLNCGGINGISAITLAKSTIPKCRITAYLSHAQLELAQQALQAGAQQVVPRSEFVVLLPKIVETYGDVVTAHVESHSAKAPDTTAQPHKIL